MKSTGNMNNSATRAIRNLGKYITQFQQCALIWYSDNEFPPLKRKTIRNRDTTVKVLWF